MKIISAVRNFVFVSLAVCILALFSWAPAGAQSAQSVSVAQQQIPARITQAIDENQRVTLAGNIHPLARPEFDQGAVSDATPMNRMMLLLQRSPQQEAVLQQLMTEQMSEDSPNFHKWLTPQQFGQQFGPADADIQTVTSWLASYGFSNVKVSQGRTVIEFSGNVGQVRHAFQTEIHKFNVNGDVRQANIGDPQIPAALTPVVAGVVSLHNFPKKTYRHVAGIFTRTSDGRLIPQFTGGPASNPNQFFIVGPADFAKIYNIPSSLNGSGSTIAIIGISDIDINDVRSFRTLFGLSANDPTFVANGPDPGKNGEEGEADLDVQISGAVAPQATIDFVISEDTLTSSGVDLGAFFVIDNNSADVMSLSFGSCEANLGANGNAFFKGLFEQAAAQGITVTVSAGDPGSAGCDNFNTAKTAAKGLAISGIASTPFNIAVGGTDFDDVGTQPNFWKQNPGANDPMTRLSALGYIKETTWNDSCAAQATSSTLNSVCTGTAAANIVGGSGGPSAVNAKPAFQNGLTPVDAARDIPDVSLFASDGPNSKSFYLVCQADALQAGSSPSCASSGPFSFEAVGGTSASSPAFAGIIALIGQSEANAGRSRRQGNANVVLYKIAQTPANACNSSSQTLTPPAACVFFDITKGNNSVPCTGGSVNCSSTSASTNGVLVDPAHTTTPAWTAGPGYDYATGLGSVSVQSLATAWPNAVGAFRSTTTSLSANGSTTIAHGQTLSFTVNVTPQSGTGTPTGDVSLVAHPLNGLNGGGFGSTLSAGAANTGTATITTNAATKPLPGGTYNVSAHYAGDTTFSPSDSIPLLPVTVNPESSSLQVGIVTSNASGAITSTNATSFVYGSPYVLRFDVLNSSGQPCQPLQQGGSRAGCALDATGNVVITDNGSALDQGTFPLNNLGNGEDQPIQLSGGTHTVVANYSGDNSYNAAPQVTLNLTVTKAATTASVASSPTSITSGTSVTLTATISTQSSGAAPGGIVQFLNGSTPISGTVTLMPVAGSATAPASLKATLTTTISALARPTPSDPWPTLPYWRLLPILALTFALLFLSLRLRRHRRLLYFTALLFMMTLAGAYGCGGGGSSAPKVKTVNITAQYSGDNNYSSSSGSTTITVQ